MNTKRTGISPGRVLPLGFLAVILTGAVLLWLPIASQEGLTFLEALFTSVSAVCVTGLSVINVGTTLTLFGKWVLLFLIQIGGLGFMTVASLLFMALHLRISLRERLVIREAFSTDSLQGLVRLVRNVLLITLVCEAVGAGVLAIRLIPQFGVGQGLMHAVFTAVSAFCNAGFDLFGGDSLVGYAQDPLLCLTVMVLIVLGGIGFPVILDVLSQRPGRWRLHTRVVLLMTGALLLVGCVLFTALEWNGAYEKMSVGGKLLSGAFQSVTLRTAGFSTVAQETLSPASTIVSLMWMLVGASPASTGGGIKTTALFVIFVAVNSSVRRDPEYSVMGRRLSADLVRRALCLLALALGMTLVAATVLCAAEPAIGLADALFECVSAIGTVGLSRGITADLSAVSRVVLMILMFFGRMGPLSLTVALSGKGKPSAVRYPEGQLMI